MLRLAELAERHPGTRVTWLLRRASAEGAIVRGEADALPQRAALGTRARRAIEQGPMEVLTGFRREEVRREADGIVLVADDGRETPAAARLCALTGFRPDLSILSEVGIATDPALDAVAGLAAAVDPSTHSCGTVAATGVAELSQPEPGCSSSARRATARRRHSSRSAATGGCGASSLPETGVSGRAGAFDGARACCAAPAELGRAAAPASV